jgi:hypothetical protein
VGVGTGVAVGCGIVTVGTVADRDRGMVTVGILRARGVAVALGVTSSASERAVFDSS